MRPRNLVTFVLLAFVAVSAAYAVWDSMSREAPPAADREVGANPDSTAAGLERTVVVYYFHGNVRCWTCRTIEAYTKEAVTTAFPTQLASGEMELRVVNVEAPGNDHFVEDYQLTTRSVVVVEFVGGVQHRWQRLDDVWNLVHDRAAFMNYIIDNTSTFVGREG